MYSNKLNFAMISRALSVSMEVLKEELQPSDLALQELMEAQRQFHQALSFSAIAKAD